MLKNPTPWTPIHCSTTGSYVEKPHIMDSCRLLHSIILQAPTLRNPTLWTPIDCYTVEFYRLLRWEISHHDSCRLLHSIILRLLHWGILHCGLLYTSTQLSPTGSYVEKTHSVDSYRLLHSKILQAPYLEKSHIVDSYRLLHNKILQAPTLRNLTSRTHIDCYTGDYYRLLRWEISHRGLLQIVTQFNPTGSHVKKSNAVASYTLLHCWILQAPTLNNLT